MNKAPKYKQPGAQTPAGGSGSSNDVFGKAPDTLGAFNVPGYDSNPVGPSQVSGQQGATTPVRGSSSTSRVGITPLQDQS
jgi:hypothetical protein